MRIVFMGTAELACPCLAAAAAESSIEIPLVVTQPDRPRGRQLKLAPPPLKSVAVDHDLPVFQPETIRAAPAVETVRQVAPDLIVVVAYGQLLPPSLLEIPPLGCVNVHASLLPRWRGAAPIQYAILNGDPRTGVTTMYINEAMDAGDIILQREEAIRPDDTSGALHDRLAAAGAPLLMETLEQIRAGVAPRCAQQESQVTYAPKIKKEQGRIDWSDTAINIERKIRAFNPWPTAFSTVNGELFKIWQAETTSTDSGQPGVLGQDGVVQTGNGGLRLIEVQPAGGRRMSFEAFCRGHTLDEGVSLA